MAVRREEQQRRHNAQQVCRRRRLGLRGGVIRPRHAHTHLRVDQLAGLLGDIEEKSHHNAEQEADPQLHHEPEGKLQQRCGNRDAAAAVHAVHRPGEHQDEARPEDVRHAGAPKNGAEEHKARHAHHDEKKQRKRGPVEHSAYLQHPLKERVGEFLQRLDHPAAAE